MDKKTKTKLVKDNTERWLLTYADLMNLLLIFFIILFTMSQVNQAKFQQLAASLRIALGSGSTDSLLPSKGDSITNFNNYQPSYGDTSGTEEDQMLELQKKLSALIESKGLGDSIEVSYQERGIVISIIAQLLFKSGSADIEPDSVKTIEEIGSILLQLPGNHIRVEGHTDTDPINTPQFPSNWELSSARATNVLRLLVEKVGIDPKTISACGYGEYRPRVPNTTEENKALNRRVDITILKSEYNITEAGSAAK